MKQTGLNHRVFAIVEAVSNDYDAESAAMETDFRSKTKHAIWYPRAVNQMRMLAKAIADAKSDDAKAIAAKLEGMTFPGFGGGGNTLTMRKDDHQLFQNMFIASFGTMDPGAKFDEEGTGWGWKTVGKVNAADTILPTTCKMDRPS